MIRYRTADGAYVSAEITVNEDGGLGLPVGARIVSEEEFDAYVASEAATRADEAAAVADIVSEQRYNQLIAMGIPPDAASGTSGWNPGG